METSAQIAKLENLLLRVQGNRVQLEAERDAERQRRWAPPSAQAPDIPQASAPAFSAPVPDVDPTEEIDVSFESESTAEMEPIPLEVVSSVPAPAVPFEAAEPELEAVPEPELEAVPEPELEAVPEPELEAVPELEPETESAPVTAAPAVDATPQVFAPEVVAAKPVATAVGTLEPARSWTLEDVLARAFRLGQP
ncbi:MAG: hypothetical protein M0R76_04470 [Proteobacteria bacterium]|nr:hypothetical protein [Pseudomonadota bacterium]